MGGHPGTRKRVTIQHRDDQGRTLPASLLDLGKPEWKGKIAISPTDADFLPLISAVETLKGKDAALAWLKGLKDNARSMTTTKAWSLRSIAVRSPSA